MKKWLFAALAICAISALVLCAGIVYGLMDSDDAPKGDELAFNDDTSIRNDSDRDLWIRVEIVYDDRYDPDDYTVISDAIDDGIWESDGDGRYYYFEAVGSGCVTKPLVDRLLYKGENASPGTTGRFSLRIEALDRTWLDAEPDSGEEAFSIFENINCVSSYDI